MVDVSSKPIQQRTARAQGEIRMARETLKRIRGDEIAKGNVLATARIAGIQAAKRTGDLIPLCHPLMLSKVTVDIVEDVYLPGLRVEATVKLTGKTGVEMEALTAVSGAALTLYDMCKAVDRGMVFNNIGLLHKSGGKSGTFDKETE